MANKARATRRSTRRNAPRPDIGAATPGAVNPLLDDDYEEELPGENYGSDDALPDELGMLGDEGIFNNANTASTVQASDDQTTTDLDSYHEQLYADYDDELPQEYHQDSELPENIDGGTAQSGNYDSGEYGHYDDGSDSDGAAEGSDCDVSLPDDFNGDVESITSYGNDYSDHGNYSTGYGGEPYDTGYDQGVYSDQDGYRDQGYDDAELNTADEQYVDGVPEAEGLNLALPDLDAIDFDEPKDQRQRIHEKYGLPDIAADEFEQETSLGDAWDSGADEILRTLRETVENPKVSDSGVYEDFNSQTITDDDEEQDDRLAALEALMGALGSDDEASGEDDDESGVNSFPKNSPFTAVDDDDVPDHFNLDQVLADAIDEDVSDIYVKPEDYITFKRHDQAFYQKQYGFILGDMTEKLYQGLISNVEEDEFVVGKELDASYVARTGRHTGRRFRMTLGNTHGAPYLNFRVVPNEVPSPTNLGVPQEIINWSKLARGVFMINGPTGSGKSTTIASLVRQIQLDQRKVIITLERPIEFEYDRNGKSLVIQRSVGNDTHSFAAGLKTALRNAPDIIVVGEVRDREEVDNLLRAAETGHLAISTMHTDSCATTISRMTGLFEGTDKQRVTDVLSSVGRGFANQLLLPSPDGSQRTAIHEVMTVNDEVSELIARNDIAGLRQYQYDRKRSMDHEIARAYLAGICDLDTARAEASKPERIDIILEEGGLERPDNTQASSI